MLINPYLSFKGECEAAFAFYQQLLGGEITAKATYGETPMGDRVPAEWRGKIIHASMKIGDTVLMGGDPPPGRYVEPKGFSLNIAVDDPAKAESLFSALAEKGAVTMPLQETFWAARFGMVTDRFGIPWIVNCAKSA